MKNLYVVETWRGVRAECETRKDAEQQAKEYLGNYGGTVELIKYTIENPDIHFTVDDGELCFYIDDNYIYQEEREDYWLWMAILEKFKRPILDY